MAPFDNVHDLLRHLQRESEPWRAPVAWVRNEVGQAWEAARAEALSAYLHWREQGDAASYAVYRAAQDRADAAQDALAERNCGRAAA